MRKTTVTLGIMSALVMVLITTAPGFSASNAKLEDRISQLEEKFGAEPRALGKISEWVTLSGTIEIEVGFESSDTDDSDSSDISLATTELGIEAAPKDWLTGFVLFSWDDDEEKVIVDEAHVTIGASDSIPYYLTAGKLYVPFGAYETMMISDPITLDLGEICDTAVQAGVEINGIRGAVYASNGDTDEADDDDTIGIYGLSMGYAMENDNFSLDVGADWINSILESDALNEMVTNTGDLKDYVAGVAVHVMAGFGPVCIIGEYVEALDDIEFIGGASREGMSAWALEAGYTLELSGFETTFALGYQESEDAVGILPESKILGSVGVAFNDYLSLACEYALAEDYNVADGRSDEDTDTVTLQLAFEF